VNYINEFSYIILRDDRIGMTGKNGCGKSTLLKMMTGEIQPDSGSVEIGDTVKIGVFSQENKEMDEDQKVIDYIRDVAEYVQTADGHITASQMLEKFLFPIDMHRSPISVLSGGERRRLYLLKVLMDAPNILFLDEPTNDLDIETLAILENYLDIFPGAVVVVSHDRYFLDKVANRIFAFQEKGKIKQYEGGYTDYKETHEKEQELLTEPTEKNQSIKRQEATKDSKPKKMSYKDQREYEAIGAVISDLEEKLEDMEEKIKGISSDYVKLQELSQQKEELEQTLETAMDRWVFLSELAEEIEKNKQEGNA